MTMGRPLKFKSVKELQEKIDVYFASCHTNKDNHSIFTSPYTITGLALALKTSRETLCNYEDRPEFFDTIKQAKLRVENYAEQQLFTGKATGPIFALKNHGWKDTQGIEHSGGVKLDNQTDEELDNRIKGLLIDLDAGDTNDTK